MTRLFRLLAGLAVLLAAPVAALCYDDVAGPARTRAFPGLADATILIVRHAEKPAAGSGLDAKGIARSKAYVDYFKHFRVDGAPVHIDALVAAADSPRSARSRLTLAPLGRAMHLPIAQPFRDADVGGLADWLGTGPGGRTILVAWHHGEIPDLLARLGADPGALFAFRRWSRDVFDDVVVLRFDDGGRIEPQKTRLIREDLPV